MKVGIEGSEEVLELSKRVEVWASLYPKVMKRVIKKGMQVLATDVRKRMRSQLHKRSGRLFKSVKARVVMKGKFAVDGEVYPKGSIERMIAAVHEKGVSRQLPGGQPYYIDRNTGKPIYLPRKTRGLMQGDKSWMRTTKPSTSVLPARPSFQPALAANRPKILEAMRASLMEAYSKRRNGIVSGVLR